MLMLSIIAREFRESARKRRAHGLRLAVGAAVAACFLFVVFRNLMERVEAPGHAAYNAIAWPLAFGIAVLAPLLAAPSIARERSEGTLGLLFLTRLRPHHIVLSKFAARLVEILWFVLLVLPLLAFPIWLGGVSHDEIISDACVLLGIGLFGTATGLCSSTLFRNQHVAFVAALVFLCAFDPLLTLGRDSSIIFGLGGLIQGFGSELFSGDPWLAASVAMMPNMVWGAVLNLVGAIIGTLLLLSLAAWRVARLVRGPESESTVDWRRRLRSANKHANWIFGVAGLAMIMSLSSAQLDHLIDAWIPRLSLGSMLVLLIVNSIATSREKEAHTLESLVCTPLSNAVMVNQKIIEACRNCWGWCLLLYAPTLSYTVKIDNLDPRFLFLICWGLLPPAVVISVGNLCSAIAPTSTRAVASSILCMIILILLFIFLVRISVFSGFLAECIVHLVLWFSLSVLLYSVLVRNFRKFAARQ